MVETNAAGAEVHPTLDTRWWWDALSHGELLIPTCQGCSYRFFPPQAFCPNCGSADLLRIATSGKGTIYSWVVIHRPFGANSPAVPYAIVAVDMEGGGRLIGRYIGDLDQIEAGSPVVAEILPGGTADILAFSMASRA